MKHSTTHPVHIDPSRARGPLPTSNRISRGLQRNPPPLKIHLLCQQVTQGHRSPVASDRRVCPVLLSKELQWHLSQVDRLSLSSSNPSLLKVQHHSLQECLGNSLYHNSNSSVTRSLSNNNNNSSSHSSSNRRRLVRVRHPFSKECLSNSLYNNSNSVRCSSLSNLEPSSSSNNLRRLDQALHLFSREWLSSNQYSVILSNSSSSSPRPMAGHLHKWFLSLNNSEHRRLNSLPHNSNNLRVRCHSSEEQLSSNHRLLKEVRCHSLEEPPPSNNGSSHSNHRPLHLLRERLSSKLSLEQALRLFSEDLLQFDHHPQVVCLSLLS